MPWVRVDDAFYDHKKFTEAGPLGIAQWVTALAWSNRNQKDGFIPTAVARRLLDWNGIAWQMWSNEMFGSGEDADGFAISEHLADCGLWVRCDGGYQIHDYHDYCVPERTSLPRWLRESVIGRDGLVCGLCGSDVPLEDLHIDHIRPVARGGTDKPENLQVAHSQCNLRKGARA